MLRISCNTAPNLFICFILVYVSNSNCTLLNKLGTSLIDAIEERTPKLTIKGLIVPVTINNIKEYNAGVKTGDMDLNITELLEKYGYPTETHRVKTIDGYILKLFRIPSNGTVVFLQHGLQSSSDDFVTGGPDKALAYLLADKGYDVWLGNSRGNKHCIEHTCLTPSDKGFWNFSWDEMGRYDLPASIDYVLKVSGKQRLIYIGHSQGTTAFFVLISENPEYNDKVIFMVAFAAVAWLSHTTSPFFQLLAQIGYRPNNIISNILGPSLSSNDTVTKVFKNVVCDGNVVQNVICQNLAFTLLGFDNAQLNFGALASINSHSIGGAATKQFEHYAQSIKTGKFRRYDYQNRNFEVYGSKDPPDYPVHKIKLPMAIFHGESDWASVKKDVDILMYRMQNNVTFHVVPYKSFAHLDFLYAKDVRELLYYDVLKVMEKYN